MTGETGKGLTNDLASEYAAICKELGCIEKPGVPLRFIQEQRMRLTSAYERCNWLLRSWDYASLTELQELDHMRRGWGPSTPTERMRRKADVAAAMHALSGAMSELTLSEEEAEAAGDEVNQRLDAAYERVNKQYIATIAILSAMDEPIPRPDIDYTEIVACLKHAVHWHDQLSPADIARFEVALSRALRDGEDAR